MKSTLIEVRSHDLTQALVEGIGEGSSKRWYMQGIFTEADDQNHNGRVYPYSEVQRSVNGLQDRISKGFSICGELDHPEDLQINLDRISHVVERVWLDGKNGMARLKILSNLPCGKIAEGLLAEGVKLGVSTRGSGDLNESTGRVSDWDVVTVDLVFQPSSKNAYPKPIYENRLQSSLTSRPGKTLLDISTQLTLANDRVAEKHFQNAMTQFIKSLGR